MPPERPVRRPPQPAVPESAAPLFTQPIVSSTYELVSPPAHTASLPPQSAVPKPAAPGLSIAQHTAPDSHTLNPPVPNLAVPRPTLLYPATTIFIAPTPTTAPSHSIKTEISLASDIFLSLTPDLDSNKVTSVGLPSTLTRQDLLPFLEVILVGSRKREDHELWKHGRRPQWDWELWAAGPGYQRLVVWDDGVVLAAFVREGLEGMVKVQGRIVYDADFLAG